MGFDGFDAVELVMAVEDRLNLSISDRNAERLRTPAELVDYLAGRVEIAADGRETRCRSAAAFREGRLRIADFIGAEAATIRPTTPVEALLPQMGGVGRRATWARLASEMAVTLPSLRLSPRRRRVAGTAIVVMGAVVVVSTRPLLPLRTLMPVLVAVECVALVVSAGVLNAMGRWIGSEVPPELRTAGDLASLRCLATIPVGPSSPDGWTRHELWELVRDLAAKSAGCPPTRVRRDSRWGAL